MSAAAEPTLYHRLLARAVTACGKDGQAYVMRPIRPADAPSLMRGYDAMSESGKWFRMLHFVPHLTEAMAEAFCTPDPARELCVVLEGNGALAGEILGGARFAGAEDGRAVEFAVSLRPEVRSLGLARQALETVLAVAKERGYETVWGTISADNAAMLALARRLDFDLRRDPDDVSLLVAERAL